MSYSANFTPEPEDDDELTEEDIINGTASSLRDGLLGMLERVMKTHPEARSWQYLHCAIFLTAATETASWLSEATMVKPEHMAKAAEKVAEILREHIKSSQQ